MLLAELLARAPNSVEWTDAIVRFDTKISRLETLKNVSATQEGSANDTGGVGRELCIRWRLGRA
jgi:hypothetical protein